MHEHIHTHTHKHTSIHSCWQVVHAQGNTSLPSTNSPSRLSTSAESNWSTYAGASTIQTMQHPSQIRFAPWRHQYPLFYSASHITAGQTTVMRLIKYLMTYSFVETRLRVNSHAGGSARLYLDSAVLWAKCECHRANMITVTMLTCWCYAGIVFATRAILV